MLKSAIDFETLVVEVLKTIKADGDLSELESLYMSADIFEALNFCVENSFVIGYIPVRTASGRIVADKKEHTFVTYDGLKFIESFNGEETSAIAKNALSKANKASKVSVIAIISAIIALLSNLDKIWHNIICATNFLRALLK